MKKLILKIMSVLVLALSITFAGAISPLTSTSNPLLQSAYADEDEATDDNGENATEDEEETGEIVCDAESGSVAWFLCPVVKMAGNLVDSFYGLIQNFMVVQPLSTDEDSAVIQVWRVARDITNIIFIIFALIVIYSQLTGLGISNYGVKRVLPRLIIAVILVNLSFFISSIAVDISNIIGGSITGLFNGIQTNVASNIDLSYNIDILWSDFTRALTAGGAVAGIAVIGFGGIKAIFWGLVLALVGAIISLAIGIATIALRQGLVLILVMISPLAFVAYLLPNTEKWYEKWKNLLFQMLFFYPMFSFLFGASKLAGWAIMASAKANLFTVLIGLIVQVMPIFFSFSLFKMSGTILGSVNSALQKLSTPVRAGAAGFTTSHQERERQKYISSSNMPGAKLRRYLDYRKQLRELDTTAANELRKNRALERAYNKASSYRGLDAEGNDVYGGSRKNFANSHTELQKRTALQATLAANAKQTLDNNLSEYGRIFQNRNATRLGDAHGEAFLNSMKQQFRAENIAQDDQGLLLDSYLKAQTNQARSPFDYNRLIKGAHGGLGHIGESSIMGQVIIRSAEIEGRRRREALIVKNKFNLDKPNFRGMVFDKAHINDNGYETDENGEVIEDSQYRLLPGKRSQKWQQYIGVNKHTGEEITREEYDALTPAQKRNDYRRVRYMEIKDDKGDIVQRVYDDDAGYMKELLIHDITIGDPINRRYNISYGLPNIPGGAEGILRRYHSTISAAMNDSKYKEHSAEVTPMLTSQANLGYIGSIGHYNIANLQSLSVASKAGPFLQNDAYAIRDWANLIASVASKEPGKTFEDYFPDEAIASYRDVNGRTLGGYRKVYDSNGNPRWLEINYNDATLTLEEQRNLLKHKIIPKAATKLVGMLNRDITPSVLENQKPDTLVALQELLTALSVAGIQNVSEDTPFDERLNPAVNIFDSNDAKILKRNVEDTKEAINLVTNQEASARDMIDRVRTRDAKRHRGAGGDVNDIINNLNGVINGGKKTKGSGKQKGNQGKSGDIDFNNLSESDLDQLRAIAKLMGRLNRAAADEEYAEQSADIDNIIENVDGIFAAHINDYDNPGFEDIDQLCSSLSDYCEGNTFLNEFSQEIDDLIGEYRYGTASESSSDVRERVNKLHDQLTNFLYALSTKKK